MTILVARDRLDVALATPNSSFPCADGIIINPTQRQQLDDESSDKKAAVAPVQSQTFQKGKEETVVLSSKSTSKRVTFAKTTPDICWIPNRREFTKQEILNCYLSKKDHERIRSDIRSSLRKMIAIASYASNGGCIRHYLDESNSRYSSSSSSSPLPSYKQQPQHYLSDENDDENHLDNDCLESILEDQFRGLEQYEPKNSIQRTRQIRMIANVVLQHQSKQKKKKSTKERRSRKDKEEEGEWLSQMCKSLTESSVKSAHLRGLMDRQMDTAAAPFSQIMVR